MYIEGIDKIDNKILDIIKENARLTYSEIGEMPYLKTEYANASEPYTFDRSAKKVLKESREIIAVLLVFLNFQYGFTKNMLNLNKQIIIRYDEGGIVQ